MKHILSLLTCSLFISLSVLAQDRFDITFSLVNSNNEPVGFSDVIAFNASDSTSAASVFSEENGDVLISLRPGDYYIVIESFGYSDTTLLLRDFTAPVDLGRVVINTTLSSNVLLEGYTIEVEKSVMDLKIDKRVYNVAADINTQGANASEVLENIPSVTVDADGNVSLRGNSNVRILVDGKLSGFASTADALKMLQADAIENIEVVTNASSRYDAEGDAGIINIILKKNKSNGFSGVANLRAGYNPEYGGGLRLNYRKNKLSLFADYNYNNSKHPGNSTTYQRLSNADTQMTYFQTYESRRHKQSHSIRIGGEYDWNARHATSADLNYRKGNGDHFYDRTYDNYNSENILFNTDHRTEDNVELEDMLEASIGHIYTFQPRGTWNTSLRYFTDKDFEDSDYAETSSLSGRTKMDVSKAHIYNDVFQVQSDLVIPFRTEGKVETGVRYQKRLFENIFRFDTQNDAGEWESPATYNDDFIFDENIYAAYVMGSDVIGKWGLQGGLRAEYSDILTWQKTQDKDRNKYLNFFPSAAVSYKYNTFNNFQWSLSRRIRRPGQWDLLPFMKFGDNREMRVGNPTLMPELTYSTEVTWMRYLNRGSILSSFYYRYTKDKIERIAEYAPDGRIYRLPLNISNQKAMGFEFIASYQFAKWVRVSSNFNFYRENIQGAYNGEDFDKINFSWTNRSSASFSLPEDFKVQVSGQYEAPRVTPQGRIQSMRWMDVAVSKDIMNQRATIGFNVRDVFNSRRFRSVTDTEELYAESNFQWRPRTFRLTFTYRFNQNKRDNDNLLNEAPGSMEEM